MRPQLQEGGIDSCSAKVERIRESNQGSELRKANVSRKLAHELPAILCQLGSSFRGHPVSADPWLS